MNKFYSNTYALLNQLPSKNLVEESFIDILIYELKVLLKLCCENGLLITLCGWAIKTDKLRKFVLERVLGKVTTPPGYITFIFSIFKEPLTVKLFNGEFILILLLLVLLFTKIPLGKKMFCWDRCVVLPIIVSLIQFK